jgi:hypothetical protein
MFRPPAGDAQLRHGHIVSRAGRLPFSPKVTEERPS